jgi:hypothetical protein
MLTACGGSGSDRSPDPSASPSGAPRTSASPRSTRTGPLTTGPGVTPGETPPTMPAIARQNSVLGASNFAAYFYRALDWSLATTDAYLLRSISSVDCESCQDYIATLDALRTQGGHVSGGRILITGVAVAQGTLVPSDYVISVTVNQEPGSAIRPSQSPSSVAVGATGAVNSLYVLWVGDHWQAREIG